MNEPRIFDTSADAARAVADAIVAASRTPRSRPFHLALSGGESPPLVFAALAGMFETGLDPSGFRLFWIDERCVGLDHPRSNAGSARRALGEFWKRAEIWRIEGERGAAMAAAAYSDILARFGGVEAFDAALIGVGGDGHVASLFPGDAALSATGLAVAARAPDGEARVTVTLPVLARCPQLFVLGWGAVKAAPISAALQQRKNAAASPLSRVTSRRSGAVWFLDRNCADAIAALNGRG